MKEKLKTLFGTFGGILFYLILFLLFCAPILVLDLPFWADLIILNVLLFSQGLFPIGDILSLVIDIWALIVALRNPTDVLSIIFFVAFALNILRFLLALISYASSRAGRKDV